MSECKKEMEKYYTNLKRVLESSDSVLAELNKILIKNDLFRKTLEKIADDKVSQEDKAILAKNILNDELEKEETELKPCPFCQGKGTYITLGLGFAIKCAHCEARTGQQDTPKEAANVWNRRDPENILISQIDFLDEEIIKMKSIDSQDSSSIEQEEYSIFLLKRLLNFKGALEVVLEIAKTRQVDPVALEKTIQKAFEADEKMLSESDDI